MTRLAVFCLLLLILLSAPATTPGQQGCEFNIIGTWQAPSNEPTKTVLYRFTPDGAVIVFSSPAPAAASPSEGLKEIARGTYELDNPVAPKSLKFTATTKGAVFPYRQSSMEIVKYDDSSFTCVKRGATPVRWTRIDPNRYFIVLAARSGEFYDQSGSAFPILIKVAGSETYTEAAGTYSAQGKRAFGA